MAIPLKVPSLGESVTQATVGTWLKKEGDPVQTDEPIVEVESEKATVALPAPAAGILRRVLKQTGDTVAIGEVVGELEEGARRRRRRRPPPARGRCPGAWSPPRRGTGLPARPLPRPLPLPLPQQRPQPRRRRRRPPGPPPARRPRRAGSWRSTGSPRRGCTAPDRVARSARRTCSARSRRRGPSRRRRAPPLRPPAPGPRERVVPMTALRRTVARRLVEAQHTAAILTTFNEVDMSRVLAVRERHGEAFHAKHGVKLGFTSFFVKASVEALRAFPTVNAEVRGTDVVYKDHYDVGVAVGGGKGLVVPVIRDADALSFAEIEKAVGELARRARENRITMDDLAGGTFTISNGGIYGSLLSTPILNPPQSGILGLHKIEKRAVVGAGDQVVVRPMMYVALSYDHRIVDGREAVSFLVRVKEAIEDPERLLLEV